MCYPYIYKHHPQALESRGFQHNVVVHERNYVDPESKAHTQAIEKAWDRAKMWMRTSRGNTTLLQSHLDEVSWRLLHRDVPEAELFERFLRDVKQVHEN